MNVCADKLDTILLSENEKKHICVLLKKVVETIYNAEFDFYLGSARYKHNERRKYNYRNGFGRKKLKTSFGNVDVKTPRDRSGSFCPVIVRKRQRNISGYENTFLSMISINRKHEDIIEYLLSVSKIADIDRDYLLLSYIADSLSRLSVEINTQNIEFDEILHIHDSIDIYSAFDMKYLSIITHNDI